MSTSVTKKRFSRLGKTATVYLILSIFLFIFSQVYVSLSYGEVSIFMNTLSLVPLIGGGLLVGLLYLQPTLSRISFNLWNSGVAVLTAGFLLRGIINLSGRSTTLDWPYWLIGAGFLGLALVSIGLSLFQSKKLTDEMVRV
ncbi:hypothetical protein [Streptococcus sp.]|uniref:hypothetical protein n=1 Tax=Streptococcus sp. TaxID=1306 RepID=UPI00391B8EC7